MCSPVGSIPITAVKGKQNPKEEGEQTHSRNNTITATEYTASPSTTKTGESKTQKNSFCMDHVWRIEKSTASSQMYTRERWPSSYQVCMSLVILQLIGSASLFICHHYNVRTGKYRTILSCIINPGLVTISKYKFAVCSACLHTLYQKLLKTISWVLWWSLQEADFTSPLAQSGLGFC